MALTILSPTSCTYDSVLIRIVTPSSSNAPALHKELRIGNCYACYLKGVLTLDELFMKHWNNIYRIDSEAMHTFSLDAREYMQTYHPEELL